MLASSFGFPVPEELVLISSGLVAYLGKNPEQFPPPYPGAQPVEMWTLMGVCFLAVFFSDFLVYSIGKYLGKYLLKYQWMH
jgi:membrane protein DedA with SNARE-associated domain